MRRCPHSQWLCLYCQDNQSLLLETDRLEQVTKLIQNPELQQPSLIVFVGNKTKADVLRKAFGVGKQQALGSKQLKGQFSLHLEPSTAFSVRPLLLIEGDLSAKQSIIASSIFTEQPCHETIKRPFHRSTAFSYQDMQIDIYINLLSPFTDVYCVFFDDLNDEKKVARFITLLLERRLTLDICPRLIIVFENSSKFDDDKAKNRLLNLLDEKAQKDMMDYLSAVDVVFIQKNLLSSTTRYLRLKEAIMKASIEMQRKRDDDQLLFTAKHFFSLLQLACGNFLRSIPFSFIQLSRTFNPVTENLRQHIADFLRYVTSYEDIINFAIPIIASCLYLDGYPPGAHSNFNT